MSSQNFLHQGKNTIQFSSKRLPIDYCPNSPETKHEFIQQEYEPEVKSCFWCGLLVDTERELHTD